MDLETKRDEEKSLDEILTEITQITSQVMYDWHDGACAPPDAARLLKRARLDWLTSLSHALQLWIDVKPTDENKDGLLILAWSNLGSLVEGWLKFFLCIWEHSYQDSVSSQRADSIFKKLWEDDKAEAKETDRLTFDELRQFYRLEVWKGQSDVEEWNGWLTHVQERRNAIHAFKPRELGSFDEFREDIRTYRRFIDEIKGGIPEIPEMPYPD